MADESGLELNNGNLHMHASDDSVRTLGTTVEHLWQASLDWAGHYPILFALCVWFAAFWVWQRRRYKLDLWKVKREYVDQRGQARLTARQRPLRLELPKPPVDKQLEGPKDDDV